MSVIDNRIVEMQFNNKQFESGVKESIGSIDKLKQSLNFNGVEKGLSELSSAINKIDLSPISAAVDSVGSKFSVLEQIAIGVCRRIGEQVANTIQQYATDLSVKQIGEGWTKYADKTTSVQTILAATGESMEYVNEQLDKLNWFTDETSYNFVDMVNNIGKFTSNGIKLDTSVTAMQGIANWAAISGQNAQSASRAMYNLAQAIGTGSVKLIDWKSIENANMATQEFKQKVLEAAAAQGTLKKQTDGTYKTLKGTAVTVQNFNSALSEGWFNKNVLMTTLDAYGSVTNKIFELSEASGLTATEILQLVEAEKNGTDSTKQLQRALKTDDVSEYSSAIKDLAKAENDFGIKTFKAAQEAKTFQDAIDATKDAVSTGWMKTFELIFGDYERAKVLWTDFANNLYDIFAAGGEARNALLSEWSNSGWDNLTNTLRDAGVTAEEFEEALYRSSNFGGFDLQKIVKEYGSLTNAAEAGAISVETVQKALKLVSNASAGTSKTVKEATLSYEELDKLGQRIRSGEFGWSDSKTQIASLMAEGFTEEEANVILKYAAASHELHRSLTEEEAAEYLKVFNKEIEESVELTDEEIEKRKELENYSLEDLMTKDGPEMVADIINNIFKGIIDTMTLVKETWNEFFGSVTAKRLKELTQQFRDFTASFALYEETADGDEKLTDRGEKIKAALDLIFGALKNVADIFKNVRRIFGQFLSTLDPVKESLLGLGKSLLLLFTSITGKANNFLGRLDLTEKFQAVSDLISEAIDWITTKIDSLNDKFTKYNFSEKLEKIKTKAVNIKNAIADLFGLTSNAKEETEPTLTMFEKFGKVMEAVRQFFPPVTDFFSNLWGDMQGIFDFSQVTNIADFVKAVVEGLISTLGALWEGLTSGVKNLGITFGDAIKMFLGWKVGNRILSAVLKDGKKGFGALSDSIGEIIDQVKEKGIMGLITGGSGEKGGGFKEIAQSLLMVGGALLLIAASLAIVASIKVEKLAKAFGFLVGTLAAATGILIGFGAAMKKLKINSLQLIGAAAALTLLGVALLFLAGAVAVFTLVSRMEDVWKGFGLMAASLGVVALALVVLAKTCSGVKLLFAATAILITSAALIALAGALALFTLVADMDGTTKALVTLAVTLGIVVVALAALALVGPMVIVGAASLLIASVAVIGLAIAIGILSLVLPGLAAGLSSFGQGIADLGLGIADAITEIGKGIGVAADEILSGVGQGVEELGKGIGEALKGVSEGIIAVGFGVGASITWIGTGISNALVNVSRGIVVAGMAIGAAFTFIGTGIGNAISLALTGLGSGIGELGTGISTALQELSVGIIAAGMGVGVAFTFLGQGIGNALQLSLGGIAIGIELLGEGISSALSAVGTGVITAGMGVGAAFTFVGQGIGNAISLALGGIGDGLTEIGKGIGKGFTYIGWGISTANQNVGKSIENLGTSIGTGFENAGSGIDTAIGTVSEAISQFGTDLSATIDEVSLSLSEGITTISESVDTFATSITNVGTGLTNVGTGISNIATGLTDIKGVGDLVVMANGLNEIRFALVKYGDYATTITQGAGAFLAISQGLLNFTGMDQKLANVGNTVRGIGDILSFLNGNVDRQGRLKNADNISTSIAMLVESMTTSLKGLETNFGEIAANAMLEFETGIANGNVTSIATLSQLGSAMVETLRSYGQAFYSIGRYVAVGFNNGMVSMQGTIVTNAAKIGASAASALRSYLKVKSPSRVFAEIGMYTVLGFAKGIEDNENTAIDSVVTLGDALVTAMQNAMDYASATDYGITPSITPVMDMSNMSANAATINGMLGSFDLQGAIARADIDGATINNTIQSKDIVNEIRQLNERMAVMDANLQNMQVVLDTGVLVGATSARMDNQFGIMAARKGRGN